VNDPVHEGANLNLLFFIWDIICTGHLWVLVKQQRQLERIALFES